jgi:hypothetical protein
VGCSRTLVAGLSNRVLLRMHQTDHGFRSTKVQFRTYLQHQQNATKITIFIVEARNEYVTIRNQLLSLYQTAPTFNLVTNSKEQHQAVARSK